MAYLIIIAVLSDTSNYIQSNSVITNCLGLAKFVRYNREFVVSQFDNVVNMDFGTEKMGKICSLYPSLTVKTFPIFCEENPKLSLCLHFPALLRLEQIKA